MSIYIPIISPIPFQVSGCSPEIAQSHFSGKLGWIRNLMSNTREDMRECVAQLFGIVVSQLPTDQFEKSIADLLKSLKDKQVEYQVWSLEPFFSNFYS